MLKNKGKSILVKEVNTFASESSTITSNKIEILGQPYQKLLMTILTGILMTSLYLNNELGLVTTRC
jgi:hypothetical protein